MNTVKMSQQTRNKSQPRFDTSKLEIGIGRRDQLKVAVEAEQDLADFVSVKEYFGDHRSKPMQNSSEATRAYELIKLLMLSDGSVDREKLDQVIVGHNKNARVRPNDIRDLRKKPDFSSN